MSTNQAYYDPTSLAEVSYVFFDNLPEFDWENEIKLREFLEEPEEKGQVYSWPE